MAKIDEFYAQDEITVSAVHNTDGDTILDVNNQILRADIQTDDGDTIINRASGIGFLDINGDITSTGASVFSGTVNFTGATLSGIDLGSISGTLASDVVTSAPITPTFTIVDVSTAAGVFNTLTVNNNATFSDGISVTSDISVGGQLVGNVFGDVVGDLEGNVVGNVTGDIFSDGVSTFANVNVSEDITSASFTGPLAGDVTGDVTGSLNGDVISSNITTTNLTSGISNFNGLTTFSSDVQVDGDTVFTADVDFTDANVTGIDAGALTGTIEADLVSTTAVQFTMVDVSSGNITGNTITAQTGFTGDLTGDVTGNVSGSAGSTEGTLTITYDGTATTFNGSENEAVTIPGIEDWATKGNTDFIPSNKVNFDVQLGSFETYATTAARNADTTHIWHQGDRALVGNDTDGFDVYIYIGTNQNAAAATSDADWANTIGTYTLSPAASGTLGGIELGFTETATQRAVKLNATQQAYVDTPVPDQLENQATDDAQPETLKVWSGTLAQYNALTPAADTLYFVTGNV